MQAYVQTLYLPEDMRFDLNFSYQLLIATSVATLVCCAGKVENAKQFQNTDTNEEVPKGVSHESS
jgi:hypothetical protein